MLELIRGSASMKAVFYWVFPYLQLSAVIFIRMYGPGPAAYVFHGRDNGTH